jgi:dienelactone hydrolase
MSISRRALLAGALTAPAAALAAERFPELRQPRPQKSPAPKLSPLLPSGTPIKKKEWHSRREELLSLWREVLGPMPARPTAGAKILSRARFEDHERLLLSYPSHPEASTEAYLLVPLGVRGRRPGMVCLHQTSDTAHRDPIGLGGREAMHQALMLVRRGYVCIAPRNFLWHPALGTSLQQRTEAVLKSAPWKTGMAKMLWDAQCALDLLCDRPEVDRRRVGAIGHSLGGKEVLYLAAFDERIRAAISCEGGVGLTFSNWDADWYLGKQIKAAGFPREQHELVALTAPRAFLLIGGNSADGDPSWPFIEAALPIYRALGEEERLGLMVHGHGHDFLPPGSEREAVWRWLDRWMEP